jgi:hypothetical protein
VGQPAGGHAAGILSQGLAVGDRRLRGGPGRRHGAAHQHHHADLLLRHLRHPARDEALAAIKKAVDKTYGKKSKRLADLNHRPST